MHRFIRAFLGFFDSLDRVIDTTIFEIESGCASLYSAYSSFLDRFWLQGTMRFFVALLDDALTFSIAAAWVFVVIAVPPFDLTGDIWNHGRRQAVIFKTKTGEVLGRRGIKQSDTVGLKYLPSYVIQAVLATEDSRFYQHFGIDPKGIFRALLENARAQEVVQGGSTLTQQLAKNLFLSPERSIKRKIHEAFLALWIEQHLSKDQILKMYLDRSYLGAGTYGIEAASQVYFGKSALKMTIAEAAILAGLFKAPSTYAPHLNLKASKNRAETVLDRMFEIGAISYGERLTARRELKKLTQTPAPYIPDWYLDAAYQEVLDLVKKHHLEKEFLVDVEVAIDLPLQKHAQDVIDTILNTDAIGYHAGQAALFSMRTNGEIIAIVGGKDYEKNQFNRATNAFRQPGSSFKPFVYLAALRYGLKPQSVVYDAPVTINGWTAKNYKFKYAGRTTLTQALAHSYNTVPLHLMLKIGRDLIIDSAHLAGLKAHLLSVASLPLGTNEVTLSDMTEAYSTFATGGYRLTPHTVLRILKPNGIVLYQYHAAEKTDPIVDQSIISDLNFMLHQVVAQGTGKRALLGGIPQAGKTGTSQDYRDAWFIGFTAHHVTGVWYGNDEAGKGMKQATGGTLPAQTWRDFMVKAEENLPKTPLVGVSLDDINSDPPPQQNLPPLRPRD